MEDRELIKLRLEVKKLRTERLIQWILLAITIVGVVFSYGDYSNKSNEIALIKIRQEAEIQLRLMNFYLENYDKFLSNDSIERKNIFTILVAIDSTFENDYTKKFFLSLKKLADSSIIKTINEIETIVTQNKLVTGNLELNNDSNSTDSNFVLKGEITDSNDYPINSAIVKLITDVDTIDLTTDVDGIYRTTIKHNKDSIVCEVQVELNDLKVTVRREFRNNKTASKIILIEE